jgi:cytochrome b561
VHALAALTHHFPDRDATLRRMLGGTHNAQARWGLRLIAN